MMHLEARWHDEGVSSPPLMPRVWAEAADLVLSCGPVVAQKVARRRSKVQRSPDARAFYMMVLNVLQGES
jgi:hypothetical protein